MILATPAPTLYQNVCGDDLHPAARCALDSTPNGNNRHKTKNFYADASYNMKKKDSCSWAFMLLQEANMFEERTFRGACYGIVSDSHNVDLNSSAYTNTTGEIMAVIQTLMLIIAANESQHVNAFTCSKTVIDICHGTVTSTADHDLSMHLKLVFACNNTIASIDLHRVPSHEGMPWRELAGCLSKRERKNHDKREPTNHGPRNFQLAITTSKYYQWRKILDNNHRYRHAYPAKPECMMAPTGKANIPAEIKINIMTYNVESAREAKPTVKNKMTRAGRLTNEWRGAIMRRQLQHRGVHLTGIQEGRNKRRAATSNGYHMISSPHQNYNCGCELW
ncbi:unnamed protein product, partial [Prorocentrum cordatum]